MTTTRKRALSFYTNEMDDQPQKTEGFFSTPRTKGWLKLTDSLDNAYDKSKTYNSYFKKIDGLISKEPDCLDAYNNAGNSYLELATKNESLNPKAWIETAQDYYFRAFKRAKELIPNNFSGIISWGHLDNRPFLRSHHGLILCHLRKKEFSAAVKLMEEHLDWNPNDNIGVRYLLGDAYLQAGDTVNARRALIAGNPDDASTYPDNVYSLGLLEFMEGNYSAAATALRIGFISNMYVAEILTGRDVHKPHFYWHGSSWNTVKSAKNYLFDSGMLAFWESIPQSIDFVDWLYNCAAVMRERLECTEINEGLTYERDFTARGVFCDRKLMLKKNIEKISLLVQKVTDSRGETRWPWEHSKTALHLERDDF